MFENIGAKIKNFAEILFFIGVIASSLGGAAMMIMGYHVWGFVLIMGGLLCSWGNSVLVYGFGELVENSATLSEGVKSNSNTGERKTIKDVAVADDADSSTHICPECGYVSPAKAAFCTICGSRLK